MAVETDDCDGEAAVGVRGNLLVTGGVAGGVRSLSDESLSLLLTRSRRVGAAVTEADELADAGGVGSLLICSNLARRLPTRPALGLAARSRLLCECRPVGGELIDERGCDARRRILRGDPRSAELAEAAAELAVAVVLNSPTISRLSPLRPPIPAAPPPMIDGDLPVRAEGSFLPMAETELERCR
jgi:hypothetical protein